MPSDNIMLFSMKHDILSWFTKHQGGTSLEKLSATVNLTWSICLQGPDLRSVSLGVQTHHGISTKGLPWLLHSPMQNTEAALLPAACRNTLPKLKYQTKRASHHPQHEEKVVGINPGGGTITTHLPCLLYFQLGSSQFHSLCVLSCRTSSGHPWGKLDTRHLLQLVITWLGFVTGVGCRLTPVTCFRGSEVCCLPGLSSSRESCKWMRVADANRHQRAWIPSLSSPWQIAPSPQTFQRVTYLPIGEGWPPLLAEALSFQVDYFPLKDWCLQQQSWKSPAICFSLFTRQDKTTQRFAWRNITPACGPACLKLARGTHRHQLPSLGNTRGLITWTVCGIKLTSETIPHPNPIRILIFTDF